MLDTIKEIAKYPLRIPSAFAEAVKKAREDQDSGFLEKLGIFFSAFTDAMGGIDKERNEVTDGAHVAVQGGITRTLQAPRTALKLKKTPGQPATTTQQVDKTLAVATRGFGQLDRTSRAHAQRAIKKLEKKLQGRSVNLNYDEVTCLGATATAVLLELKHQYPNKADFKKALDSYLKASEGSNFPLKKIMKLSTLGIFNLKSYGDKFKLLGALGLGLSGMVKLLALTGLTKSPIENEAKIISFFKSYILKNTSSSNIALLVKRMNKIATSGRGTMTTDDIAEITFLIDDRDLKHLISVLTNNRS